MTPQIILVLTILLGSILLFAWEAFGPDLVAMLVLVVLALTGLVSPEQAFSGFASPAVVTVWAIYIISEGLFKTGVADYLGANILRLAGPNEARLTFVIMLTVGLMSAFMNNIGATAVLLPAIIGISKQTGFSPSKFLIPLSFASLMGGNMTLIGTPPNILASGILQETTHQFAFAFFDFLPMGLIILGGGILYMTLIGRHLLPASKIETDLARTYQLRDYATELRVLPDSPLVGKTILESRFGEEYDLTIVGKLSAPATQLPTHLTSTRRLSGPRRPVRRTEIIQANDVFLVQGNLENLLKIKDVHHLEIGSSLNLSDADLTGENLTIAEMVFTPASDLVGKTLKEARFREKYNLTVLALWRAGHPIRQKLANIRLQFGDVLLVQGTRERIELARNTPGLLVLEPVPHETRRTHKAPVALAIMGGMLLTVTMGWLHISVAAVIAAMAMVALKVLSMDEAYKAIQWRSIFLIAGMLPLGIAMEQTRTAHFLADQIIALTGQWGGMGVLLGLYILTLLITQPMSNAAATVLITPIAIDAALKLGIDPRPFAMAVVIAASTAFITPIG
ncbi:MAG: SLC13 family permease, partial [Caldilineae bacterium]